MSYIKPGVLVVQEIRQASPPLLLPDQPACIVGPAYKYYDEQFLGQLPSTEFEVPIIPGSTFDTDTAKVYLKNAAVVYLQKAGVDLSAGQSSLELSDEELSLVSAGDVVAIADENGNEVLRTYVYKVEGNTVYLLDTIPQALTNATVSFARQQELELTSDQWSYDPAYSKLTIDPTKFEVTVLGGDVYASYRVLRSDLAKQFLEFQSVEDIENQLGEISTRNPLAYAVAKALANTTVAVNAMAVREDSTEGYGEALTELRAYPVYFLVLLTQDPAVFGLLPSYVDELSKPEVSKWRMVLISPTVPFEKVLRTGSGSISQGVLTDDSAQFYELIGTGTEYHYYVVIGDQYYPVEYTKNNQQLQLAAPYPPDAESVDYKLVMKVETKVERKLLMKEIAESFNNKRIVCVSPDRVIDDEDQEVPGYHLAAAIAGMLSGLPPHKPATYMAIGGFKRAVFNDGTYFTEEDLNDLAESGWLLVVQDNVFAPLYIRHQLTTARDNDYNREISVVRTIDAVSDILRKAVQPFIGKYNITDETKALIKQTLDITARQLANLETPFIGPMITDYKIGDITQLSATSLLVEVDLNVPTPLNYLWLRVAIPISA